MNAAFLKMLSKDQKNAFLTLFYCNDNIKQLLRN